MEHDGVPVCNASVEALTTLLEARAEFCDEDELYFIETQMLECFDTLIQKGA